MTDQFLHGVEVQDVDDGTRSISTVSTSIIGLIGTAPDADPAAFPLNQPVLVTGQAAIAKLTGIKGGGTLPDALDSIFDQTGAVVVVVRVEAGADDNTTLANVVGGVDATTGQYTGVHAFLGAEHATGQKPKILIAPGWTHQVIEGSEVNGVVAELKGVADRLRAVIIADGPNTNDSEALARAKATGGKRVYLIDPQAQKTDSNGNLVGSWSSAQVAGVIARTDNQYGWWWSPSNKPINGIVGTVRPIDFEMGDPSSRANLLNAGNVATIVRQNGFLLWGNRTLSADQKWQYLSVVRTADVIAESVQKSSLWAVDQGITKNYVSEVQESVNAYLRSLKAQGAIIDGKCWVDKDLNSAESIAAGHIYWDFDFTPAYPAEHITFRSHLVNNYISEIF